jgi:hypothetical protein
LSLTSREITMRELREPMFELVAEIVHRSASGILTQLALDLEESGIAGAPACM